MKPLFMVLMAAFSFSVHSQTWQSGAERNQLIELYTSEGCSSCPPADQWFSALKDQPGLFDTFIPVAFHVDYWDYIGWKDRFADAAFSQRQRQYRESGHIRQVYTPEFIINSQEWRQWFRGQRVLPPLTESAAVLWASLKQEVLNVHYGDDRKRVLNVAYLGMGLHSDVGAGENKHRRLTHDFVVLKHVTFPGHQRWHVTLPERPEAGQEQTAIAIWISSPDSQQVLQAVGGFLQ